MIRTKNHIWTDSGQTVHKTAIDRGMHKDIQFFKEIFNKTGEKFYTKNFPSVT